MQGFAKTSTLLIVFALILVWTFAGWPRVWNKLLIPPPINMVRAASVTASAGTVNSTSDTGCANNGWTNPTNSTASDNLYADITAATYDANDVSFELQSSNFGFALPAGSTVDGILVEIERYAGAGSAVDQDVSLTKTAGVQTGTNKATTTAWASADPNSYVSYGGAADLWGTTWTEAEVEGSGFGVVLCVKATAANTDVFVDHIRITVSYTPPANTAPSVSAVNISPAPINLTENGTTTVTITATITDTNGCDDVFVNGTTTATLYRSGVGASCSADANNCYVSIPLTEVDDTCTGGADTTGDASGTVQVWYIAEATDASSTFSAQNWETTVKAIDAANASSTATGTAELNTLLAINVTASINYGIVLPGATSTTQTVTITNTGNFNSTDSNFSGVNLEFSANFIAVGQQRYSTTTSEAWDSLDYTLSGTATFRELNITKATATTSPSTQSHFWAIQVPTGQAAGNYNGTTTIEAR